MKKYPYYSSPSPRLDLLPRPRFSTTQHDALFVHIETELPSSVAVPQHHPIHVIVDAFTSETGTDASAYTALWERIRMAGSDEGAPSPGGYSGVARIFSDESSRFLSLLPIDPDKGDAYNPFVRNLPSRGRSFSFDEGDTLLFTAAAITNANDDGAPPSSPLKSSLSGQPVCAAHISQDWVAFSTSGFFEGTNTVTPLAATLLGTENKDKEKDEEKGDTVDTSAAKRQPFSHKARQASSSSWRRSSEMTIKSKSSEEEPRSVPRVSDEQPPEPEKAQTEPKTALVISKSTIVSLMTLDEAFIDFWHDALLDPIASSFPPFVICKLKSTLQGVEVDGKKIEWLVIERVYKRAPSPTLEEALSPVGSDESAEKRTRRGRPASPRSFISDLSFGATFKRFSLFGSSGPSSPRSPERTPLSRNTSARGRKGRVGEMGEVLVEEEEGVGKGGKDEGRGKGKEGKKGNVESTTVKLRIPSPKSRKSMDVKSVDLSFRKSVDLGSRKSVDHAPGTNGNGVGLGAVAAAAATATVSLAAVEAVKDIEAAEPEREIQEATGGPAGAAKGDVLEGMSSLVYIP